VSFPSSRTPQEYSAPTRPLSHASGSKVYPASAVHGVRPSSHSRHGSADLIDGGCEFGFIGTSIMITECIVRSIPGKLCSVAHRMYVFYLCSLLGLSSAPYIVNRHEQEQELNREREREWNKPHPHPKTPELHHRHSYSQGSNSSGGRGASPTHNLTNGPGRKGSLTSLKSLDDGRSSRTSSFGSQAECEYDFVHRILGDS